jgi:hypothetical protein
MLPTACRIGDLAALDMGNPSRRFSLNLARALDRAVAQRLQAAALQEEGHPGSWRGAAVDGLPLRAEALLQLHMYAVPSRGVLQLDYASSQVRGRGQRCPGG